eukprot:TRINITY_DN11959_c0_g1_i1.p1 TRINITY_DN11959_c0_g1~~TRINITY_DN11959_c0_g1_i1.p1  ORF type:complete len:602 (-),score=140.13 TRINITY_DN11959_c0_g1_i1:84-1862(-)
MYAPKPNHNRPLATYVSRCINWKYTDVGTVMLSSDPDAAGSKTPPVDAPKQQRQAARANAKGKKGKKTQQQPQAPIPAVPRPTTAYVDKSPQQPNVKFHGTNPLRVFSTAPEEVDSSGGRSAWATVASTPARPAPAPAPPVAAPKSSSSSSPVSAATVKKQASSSSRSSNGRNSKRSGRSRSGNGGGSSQERKRSQSSDVDVPSKPKLADLAAHIAAVVTAAEEAAMYGNNSDSPYPSDDSNYTEDEDDFTSETSSIGSSGAATSSNNKIFSDTDEIVPLPRRGLVDLNLRLPSPRADPPPGASPRSLPPPPGLAPQTPLEIQAEMLKSFSPRDLLIPPQSDPCVPTLGLDIFARAVPPLSPMQPPMPHSLSMFHPLMQMNQLMPPQLQPQQPHQSQSSPFARLRVGENNSETVATGRQPQISVNQLLERLPKEESVPENIPEIRRILASLQETASNAADPPSDVRSFDSLNVLLQSIQDQARAAQERLKQAHTQAPGAAAAAPPAPASNPTAPPLIHGSSPLWSTTPITVSPEGSIQPPQMVDSVAVAAANNGSLFAQNPLFPASLWGNGSSNSDSGLNSGFQSYFSAFHN